METEETQKQENLMSPVWCIAANVVMERPFGPGGEETRSGTKHFAPGAKVCIVDFFWGMGGEDVTVVGHHRKSHRFITIVMRSKLLVNWRAELIYSPRIIKEVVQYKAYKPESRWIERVKAESLWNSFRTQDENDWASSPGAKEKVEDIIETMKKYYEFARATQPPTTRPPQPK